MEARQNIREILASKVEKALIPGRRRSKFWPWESGKRRKKETVDNHERPVQKKQGNGSTSNIPDTCTSTGYRCQSLKLGTHVLSHGHLVEEE